MLTSNNFTFQYPTADEPALSELTISIDDGDVLGVIGPVEAGKTTLSMALAGYIPAITGGWSDGDLSVAGRDPREAEDNQVAMVFEDYSAQLTQLRAIDEVIAPLTNSGMPRDEATERARELLDIVRFEEAEDTFTWELSGGQQQRLAIAAAIAIDPEVLIFDTATDMLDPEGREDVASLIASLADEKTLVVTENNPDALVGIVDQLLVLEKGETVAFGPADELLRDSDLFAEIGVAPPVCLDVSQRIGLPETPITIGDVYKAYTEHLGQADITAAPAMSAPDGGTAEPPSLDDSATTASSTTDGSPLIEVTDATFSYPNGTLAVSGVDLTVHEGDVHAIIGGNGAGKSTLSKLLVGLMTPSSGTVSVNETATDNATARELAESIGIALQNPDEQLSQGTVSDELRYALEQRRYERHGPFGLFGKRERYDDASMDERVAEVANLVGIDEPTREKDPAFLPRGQRRLVTIAAALAPNPAAIVLDEPCAGLDASAQTTVIRAIDRLRRDGTAVVLVEHNMDVVCEVADRITVLDDGAVAMQGSPPAVFARDNWEWLSERYMRPPKAARLAARLGVNALTADRLVDELRSVAEVSG